MPFLTCTLTPDQPPRQSNILGAGRQSAQPFFGLKPCLGELTGPLDLVAIGYILRCVFGDPTTTGSNPYTHVFTHGASTPSFLVDKGFMTLGQYYLFNGCKAKGMLIKLMEDKQLAYSLLIMGAKETPGEAAYQETPTTDVSSPETIFGISDVSVMLEGGLTNTEIDELEIRFMNNSQIGFGLAESGEGSGACEGSIGIEGRIRGLFVSDDLLLKGREHTDNSLSITFAVGSYSLKIEISELQYNHNSSIVDGPGGAYVDLLFVGYCQNNDDTYKITLVNGHESYIPVNTAWDIGFDEVV